MTTVLGSVFIACVLICGLPVTVYAHLVNTEVGEFYAGMMHPLTSIEHFLPMTALVLLASQMNKQAVRYCLFLFPGVLGFTIFIGKNSAASELIHSLNLFILVPLGLCLVFANRIKQMKNRHYPVLILTCCTASILGYRSGVDMANAQVGIQFVPGVVVAGFIFFALTSAWIPQSPGGAWNQLRSFVGVFFCIAGLALLYHFFTGDTATTISPKIGLPSEDSIKEMMAQKNLSITFIAGTLFASLLWGAGHALTPGHGKAIVGAYLVGAHSSAWHAIYLGLTVTITHTLGVFILGLIAIFASRYVLPEDLYPYLGAVSGLIVIVLGSTMLWNRLKTTFGHHHHHHHHVPHSHNGHSGHSHLPPGADGKNVNWKSLLGLGISGGLLPCPSALVLLLTAISLDRTEFGMLLVVSFSLGLAGVLTTVGLIFVKGSRILKGTSRFERVARHIPTVSAFVILIIGILITFESVQPFII